MEIIAHHKKKKTWQLSLDSMGQIQTGMQNWDTETCHQIEIPIFKAKLQYAGHHQGTRSIMVDFRGDDADSLISILRGTGPCHYEMDKEDGFETMEALIRRNDPFFTYYDDGWFEGIFTFQKRGNRVYLTPFRGDISKEIPVEK